MKLIVAGSLISVSIVMALLCSQYDVATVSATETVNRQEKQTGAERKGAQEAQRIWELAISAKGGRQRLDAVKNVAISTIGSYTTGRGKENTVRTEAFFALPNKIWLWMDYRPDVFGLTIEMYNFDSRLKYVISSSDSRALPKAIGDSETSASHTQGLLPYLLETNW